MAAAAAAAKVTELEEKLKSLTERLVDVEQKAGTATPLRLSAKLTTAPTRATAVYKWPVHTLAHIPAGGPPSTALPLLREAPLLQALAQRQREAKHPVQRPQSLQYEAQQLVSTIASQDILLGVLDAMKEHLSLHGDPHDSADMLAALNTAQTVAQWQHTQYQGRLAAIEAFAAHGMQLMEVVHRQHFGTASLFSAPTEASLKAAALVDEAAAKELAKEAGKASAAAMTRMATAVSLGSSRQGSKSRRGRGGQQQSGHKAAAGPSQLSDH